MTKRLIIPVLLFMVAAVITTVQLLVKDYAYDPYGVSMKIQRGDSAVWSNPAYDDTHWNQMHPIRYKGMWWVRMPITINSYSTTKGLMIETSASYDAYVDGRYIGSNGRVGKHKAAEVPGNRIHYFILPALQYTNEPKLLALRVSNFYERSNPTFIKVRVGDYFSLVRSGLKFAIFIHMLAGVFGIIGIYYFILFIISFRRAHYLLFGILCFLFFLMIGLEYLKTYYLYAYPFQHYRLLGITGLSFLIAVTLFLFLLYRFQVKGRWLYTTGLCIFLLIIWVMESHWDDRTKSISMAGITVASFLSLYTIYKQQKGATEIFYGIIACLSCYYYFDITFYIGFSFLVICVLISLSRELKEERKERAEAVRRSNRLEVELLKKTLQPHFLMNSLSTLMEFIETQPQKSLPFITALASEFDILNEVSALKLIPVTKELELCASYLEIMSFRKDQNYKLEAVNMDGGEEIPPAVFLTILENGIMHNRFDACPDVVFRISLERCGDQKLYTISIPGKPKAGSLLQKEGTGLKYVKARLEESYGSRFSILSGTSPTGGWETKIGIKC